MQKSLLTILAMLFCGILFSQQNPSIINLSTSDAGVKNYAAQTEVNLNPGYLYTPSNSEMNAYIEKHTQYISMFNNTTFNQLTTNTSLNVGTTAGSVDIGSNGSATYSIPLTLPMGKAGISPNLSITYNSLLGDDLLGKGWTLAGLSAITVSNFDWYNDDQLENTNFSSTTKFAMDGTRLLATTGVYGANNTVYSTEQEGDVKIVSYGSIGSLPSWFTVQTKDGKTIEYGNSVDSKVINESGQVIAWKISKVYDLYGNYMIFNYINNDNNHRISSIKYTGNSVAGVAPYNEVKFVYQTRNDINEIYQFGYKKIAKQLLEKVVITTENEHFKTYVLSYGENLNAYLVSIQEQGADYSALNPTYFNYGNTPIGFSEDIVNTLSGLDADIQGSRDFNGDGRTDILLSYYTIDENDNKIYTSWEARVADNSGVYFSTYATGVIPAGSIVMTDEKFSGFSSSFDFKGDGESDVLLIKLDVSTDGLYCLSDIQIVDINGQNQTSTYSPYIPGGGCFVNPSKFLHIGDFDGNGRDDLIILRYSNATNLTYSGIYIDNINGASNISLGGLQYLESGGSFYYTDIDGDLKQEIAVIYSNTIDFFEISSQTISGILVYHVNLIRQRPNNLFFAPRFGDFNGDGKSDMLYQTTSCFGTCFKIDYFTDLSVKTTNFSLNPTENSNGGLRVGDFNGDGKTDISHSYGITTSSPNTSIIDIYYSNGIGFVKNSYPISLIFSNHNFIQGDFNGDSKTEFINKDYNPISLTIQDVKSYKFKIDSRDHLLTNIKDGFLRNTTLNYDWLSKGLIYTEGISIGQNITDASRAMPVVKSVSTDNGINEINTIYYFYKGAKWHMQGKGFMGFEELKSLIPSQNLVSVKKYALKYAPLINLKLSYLSLDEETLTSNQEISKKTYLYNTTQISGIRYRLTLAQENSYDYITTFNTQTNYSYNNATGNLTSSTFTNGVETITTSNTYGTFGSWWIASVLTSSTTTKTRNGEAPYSRTKNLSYNNKGSLIQEVSDPGLAKSVTSVYDYDNFGNVIQTTVSATGLTTRNNYTSYDYFGRYITSVKNSLNQVATINPDRKWGKPLTSTDISGLTTTYSYNGFGGLLTTQDPKGNITQNSLIWDIVTNSPNLTTPKNTVYYAMSQTTGAPTSKIWFDIFEREVKSEKQSSAGNIISITKYDEKGRLASTTEDFISGQTPLLTTYTYDEFSRPTGSTNGTNTSTISYSANLGLQTISTSSNSGANSTSKKDASGKIVSSDDGSGLLNYTYYSNGLQKTVSNSGINLVSSEYDSYGNQTKLIDINGGTTLYDYDAFGQLISQTDANGNTYSFTYDILGRDLTKTGPEGVTTSTYVSSGNGINKLLNIVSPNGVTKQFTYDSYDRILTEGTTVDLVTYTYTFSYNNLDQIATVQYPGGLRVKNFYSSIGELNKVTNNSGSIIYYELPVYNQRGQLTNYKLGNGKTSTITYNNLGLLTNKVTPLVQNYELTTNPLNGNVTSRKDYLKNLYEDFEYDQFDQLIETTTGNIGSPTIINQNNMIYSTNGNIAFKSDAGSYYYDATKVNAVSQVDNSGGNIPSLTQTITYTPFDRPESITEGTYNYSLTYGPDLNRVKSILTNSGTTAETKYYIGQYEKEIIGVTTKEINYIQTGDGTNVAVVKQSGVESTFYLYTDHLGSVTAVTNNTGTIVYEQNFDAWGRRRSATNWTYNPILNASYSWVRGFTGHEHIDEFGIINMNNRLYDPILARMLSVDNFVQNSTLQGYNRFSYALNNPLKYTDPSGEFIWAPIIIGAAMGGFGGYQIAKSQGYDFGDWQTYGYILGGAAVGAISGSFGTMISGAGGMMSQTISTIFTSTFTSVNMSVMSGGELSPYTSIGVASVTYNQGNFTINYPFKKGNNVMTNIGFIFGSMSFIQDCFAADEGVSYDIYSRKGTLWGHSEGKGTWIDDDGNSHDLKISVGPKIDEYDVADLKKGTLMVVNNDRDLTPFQWEKQFTFRAPLGENVSYINGNFNSYPINNVNGKLLSNMSSNLDAGKTLGGIGVFRYGLLRGCVNYTSRALLYSGVINVNAFLPLTSPQFLIGELFIRQMGIYSSPYLTK